MSHKETAPLGTKLARELRRRCNTRLSLLHQSAWYEAANELEKFADTMHAVECTAPAPQPTAKEFYEANATNVVNVPRPNHPEDASGWAGVRRASQAQFIAKDVPCMPLWDVFDFAEKYATATPQVTPTPVQGSWPKEFSEGFSAGMRAGEIARWIPVEEKSPEITRTWTDCGNVYRQSDELLIFDSVVGRRTGCFYGPGWSGSEGDKLTSVTHWQPLPAAPMADRKTNPV